MNFLWLILCALAAFRLAELLVIDDGPFDVFFHLRGWANRPPAGSTFRSTLAGLLSCVHCAGFWMSILVGLLWFSNIAVLHLVIFILAIAGLQSIFARNLGRTSS